MTCLYIWHNVSEPMFDVYKCLVRIRRSDVRWCFGVRFVPEKHGHYLDSQLHLHHAVPSIFDRFGRDRASRLFSPVH